MPEPNSTRSSSSCLEWMLSFSYTCLMWVRVVLCEISSSSAMYFALRPIAMSPKISTSRGVSPFSSASFWQYASSSEGNSSPPAPLRSSPASASSRFGSSTLASSARFGFRFDIERASCRPTLKKYSAVSPPAAAIAYDERPSVDTRAISWPMHIASNMSPTASPRMAYTDSRMS